MLFVNSYYFIQSEVDPEEPDPAPAVAEPNDVANNVEPVNVQAEPDDESDADTGGEVANSNGNASDIDSDIEFDDEGEGEADGEGTPIRH